jgi:hypothetical protein
MAGFRVDSQVTGVCDAILRYLALHPNAADSALGIQQWWLKDLNFNPTLEQVQAALKRLTDGRLIQRHEHIGGVEIYSTRSETQ